MSEIYERQRNKIQVKYLVHCGKAYKDLTLVAQSITQRLGYQSWLLLISVGGRVVS